MTKFLYCRDAGFDCDAVVSGDNLEEILAQVRPHASDVHNVEVDSEMEAQLAALVKDG